MYQFCIFAIISVTCVFSSSSTLQREEFSVEYIHLGKSANSWYFLSNTSDIRSVKDARVGCEDGLRNGKLVALETHEENEEVRRWLSAWGVRENDRVWTTGQHSGSQWIWYDYFNGVSTLIENACAKNNWVNGVCPTSGCIAIGGRDLNYKWEADYCDTPRRYLCESPMLSIEHLK